MPVVEPRDLPVAPAGQQWLIGHGQQQAVITEVGATLREYSIGGRALIDGFSAQQWSHGGRGQVLAPWPNRLADGRYEFEGESVQAAIDEPERGNAIHGLVRWLPWRAHAHAQNVVSMFCQLHPTPGYPFSLELRIDYRLGRGGLTVATSARNTGEAPLPFGVGFHPYLTVGTDVVDTAVLSLPATRRLVLDDRAIPTGDVRPVTGTEFDFTAPRWIGPTRLDTAFTGLERDEAGRAWATLVNPVDDVSVALWMDERFEYLMCYTADTVDEAHRRRSVAVEPMTCAPNAFRSGAGLVTLGPGQAWAGSWGIRPS
jgi:aldose 1-epimerase